MKDTCSVLRICIVAEMGLFAVYIYMDTLEYISRITCGRGRLDFAWPKRCNPLVKELIVVDLHIG